VQRRGHLPAVPVVNAAASEAKLTTPWQRYDGWRIGGQT
jgi:hypothetical protein